VPGGPLAAMSAVSPSDVWAVGATARDPDLQLTTLVEHWNGSSWRIVPAPDVALSVGPKQPGDLLTGVAAVSIRDVWAVGASARSFIDSNGNTVDRAQTLAEHWNGTRWSVVPTPDESPDDGLVAVSALSASDVWAVGLSSHAVDPATSVVTPLVEHWDGAHWSLVQAPTAGLDPSNAVAVATAQARQQAGKPPGYDDVSFSAVHAVAADDVWAVGAITPNSGDGAPGQTFTEHWNGTRWSVIDTPDVGVDQLQHKADDSLGAVTATAGDDVWAVGSASPQGSLTLHWDGSEWTVVPSARSGAYGYLSDVAALSPSDVWAAGSAIEHWDGHRWTQTATIDGRTFKPLLDLAAVSAHDVWMVGQDEFLHYTCTPRG